MGEVEERDLLNDNLEYARGMQSVRKPRNWLQMFHLRE